jgi:hypothetical protein
LTVPEVKEIPMPYHIYKELKEYLEGREYDIAWDVEDFGALKAVFIWALMRSPSGE